MLFFVIEYKKRNSVVKTAKRGDSCAMGKKTGQKNIQHIGRGFDSIQFFIQLCGVWNRFNGNQCIAFDF